MRASFSECIITNSGKGAKPVLMGGMRQLPKRGLLEGREGTHQCTRSRMTEKLVNYSTEAKRVAH